MQRRRAHPGWLVLGACMLLAIMAPGPGAIGSCSGDGDLDTPVDFQGYCQQREQLACVRRFLRKEIIAKDRDACRFKAIDDCEQRSFPRDCQPTQRQANTCLNALSSFDTLQTKESALPECNTRALCTATPAEQGDAGVFDP